MMSNCVPRKHVLTPFYGALIKWFEMGTTSLFFVVNKCNRFQASERVGVVKLCGLGEVVQVWCM